jgi:diadenosine tetraphosphate (Ap4A) HIT family hydrolase
LPGGSCYLCEAGAGRTEKPIVEETEQTVTLVNWKQFELGQVYIITKRHAPTLLDLTEEEEAAIFHTARRTADALVRAYDPDGINLIQNNGVVAGQYAPHFHMHVVPRRKVGSDWGNGPPHIAALERKESTEPKRDVLISVEQERQIARHIASYL